MLSPEDVEMILEQNQKMLYEDTWWSIRNESRPRLTLRRFGGWDEEQGGHHSWSRGRREDSWNRGYRGKTGSRQVIGGLWLLLWGRWGASREFWKRRNMILTRLAFNKASRLIMVCPGQGWGKKGSRVVVIQAWDDGGLDQGSGSEGAEKWPGSGCNMKTKPTQ